MRRRIVALTLLLTLTSAVPASAFLEGIVLWVMERSWIRPNQDAQIANQVLELREMVSQLQTARNQLQFVQDSAQGLAGAINDSMRDLIAEPLGFYDGVATWKDDFTGQAADIAEAIQALSTGVSFRDTWQTALDDARTVTAATVRAGYAARPPDVAQAAVAAWQDREAQADDRLARSHTQADAGAAAQATAAGATAALHGLADQIDEIDPIAGIPNRSASALQEADALGSLTQVDLLIASAHTLAVQSAAVTADQYEAERARLQRDADFIAERRAAAAALQTHLQAIEAQRANRQRGLELRLHPMYGGN